MINREMSANALFAAIGRWFASTPHRTFIVYPAAVVLSEVALRGGHLNIDLWAAPFLLWGYLQYRLVGRYRRSVGGGGPGTDIPPVGLVSSGPYRYVRNPMYLGHLIFLLALTITFNSLLGLVLFLIHIPWFHHRVLRDEARLKRQFGGEYIQYMDQTPRWIPAITARRFIQTVTPER